MAAGRCRVAVRAARDALRVAYTVEHGRGRAARLAHESVQSARVSAGEPAARRDVRPLLPHHAALRAAGVRARVDAHRGPRGRGRGTRGDREAVLQVAALQAFDSPPGPDRARCRAAVRTLRDAPADRKSTRLNSSHVKNSYAVF